MGSEIVLAITGSSGMIYGQRFLMRAVEHFQRVHLVISPTVPILMEQELGLLLSAEEPDPLALLPSEAPPSLKEQIAERVRGYHYMDFQAPFASGSNAPEGMAIVPCSQGTLARIVAGVSDNLITRAADVVLKERRRLVVVPRETPLSAIHLRTWLALTEAGGVVMPASPAFYHRPRTIAELVDSIVERALAHLGVPKEQLKIRWGEEILR